MAKRTFGGLLTTVGFALIAGGIIYWLWSIQPSFMR